MVLLKGCVGKHDFLNFQLVPGDTACTIGTNQLFQICTSIDQGGWSAPILRGQFACPASHEPPSGNYQVDRLTDKAETAMESPGTVFQRTPCQFSKNFKGAIRPIDGQLLFSSIDWLALFTKAPTHVSCSASVDCKSSENKVYAIGNEGSCTKSGISLRKGVLLIGPVGAGKHHS